MEEPVKLSSQSREEKHLSDCNVSQNDKINVYDIDSDTCDNMSAADNAESNEEDPNEESVTSERTESANQMSQRHRLSSSERSNTIKDDNSFVSPPKENCPELIVFCIDASADMEKLTFRSRAGDKLSPRNQTKKGLGIYLQSKSRVDKSHQFALMLLKESAFWVRDLTNNPRDILLGLEDSIESEECDTCDIGSVFDEIYERIDLPKIEGEVHIVPPPYIVRLVLIYGRSNRPLELDKRESFNQLNASPYFFLDVIYIHEPISEENQCQAVFDSICDLDQTGQSYIFNVSRNPTKLFDHMAQLLAHPLQRPLQNEASYRIGSSIPQPENG